LSSSLDTRRIALAGIQESNNKDFVKEFGKYLRECITTLEQNKVNKELIKMEVTDLFISFIQKEKIPSIAGIHTENGDIRLPDYSGEYVFDSMRYS